MKTPKLFRVGFLLLLLAFPIFGQTSEEQSVREVVTKFCEAVQQKSVEKLKQTTASNWAEGVFNQWQGLFDKGEYAQFPLKSFTIRWVKIEGERANARVFWERTDAKTNLPVNGFQINHRIFSLKKENSVWKITSLPTAENELISQIITADFLEERKRLIGEEKELNTPRIMFVIIFRLQNEGKYELTEEYFKLAEWFNSEFYKGKNEVAYANMIANILNARAANQISLGNYAEALRFYLDSGKAAEEFQMKTGEIIAGAALTQINIGVLYFRQGNLEQAERFALDALKTLESADRIKQNVLFYSIYNLLGDIYFQRGDDEKAIEFYRQNGGANSPRIGTIYLRQGKFAEALKIFQEIADAIKRAIAQKEQINLPEAVEVHSNLVEIFLRQGEPEKALLAARRTVEFAEQSKNPELIFIAKNVEGKALLVDNKLAEAESAFRVAIETVETGRQKVVGGEESKISFFENRVEPYQKMIELSVKRGDAKTALEFAERGKSRVLNEILQIGRIEWQKVLNESDKQKEETLHGKLTELNRLQTVLKYQTEIDKTRLADVTKQIEQVRLDYEFLQTSAFANYAELRRSRGIGTSIKTDEIAALIRQPNEALLEFAVSGDQIYLFAATKEKSGNLNLQVYQLDGKTKEIINLANDFRQRIVEQNLDFKESARKFYDVLFKKAAAQLAGKTNLTIVPDGELWNVPFSALITPENRFLIETKMLNFAQSLTALKELQNIKTSNGKTTGSLLAVGNPRLDEKTILQVRAQYRGDIGDLPAAETEVLALQKLYGKTSKILTKADAREDVWKAEAGNYQYLHLATHGLANSIKPLYSHLFLASDSNKSPDDGLLEAWEIMNLRLTADLAVLSACETAQGRTNAGEGLIGLSWVFAVANVPRIVASQWKIESASTTELMTEFHRQLRLAPNKTVAKSLQTAMRNQFKKSNRRHPFYLSGFISIGKN